MHLEEKPDATKWRGRCKIFSQKSKYLLLVTEHLCLACYYFSEFFTQHTLTQCLLCPGTAFCLMPHRSLFFSGSSVKVRSVKGGWRLICSSCCCWSLASLHFTAPVHYFDIWWVEIYPPLTALKGFSVFSQKTAFTVYNDVYAANAEWELSLEAFLSDSASTAFW